MHLLPTILFSVYQVIVVLTIIHVVMDNRQPVKTMAWALVIYFVPVAGIVLYLFFGVNTRKERLVSRRSMDQLTKRSMLGFVEQHDLRLPEQQKPLIDLFVNQSFSLPFKTAHVELLTDGYQFFASLLRDISRAKSHIHIDVYIFEDDALGQLVSDALIDRARSGVEVRIVYDDVGCWKVRNGFFERMREEGIEIAPFLPVRFPSFTSKVNYRNHRKLFIVDGRVGYIGGMNIARRYVKGVEYKGKASEPWRDTMVRIEGAGVYSLQRTFLVDWYFVDRTLLSDRKYYPAFDPQVSITDTIVQTVMSNPTSPYPEIQQGYLRIILAARRYLYIETPYFLPTEPVLFALKTAAQSGVDVRILVPRRSDARFVEWASRSYLREAVEAGARVSLYEAGFLHSKLMVADDAVSTCGSVNVDFRSFENNFEANMFFYGEQTALQMRRVFEADETCAVNMADQPQLMNPRFLVRLWESFVRLLSPLM